MHEPDSERCLRVEALARHEVAARRVGADPCERKRRDDGGDDPELHLGEREDGVVSRDRDVGRRHETGTATQRMSLYPCDDGCGAAVDRLEHRAERVRVGDVLLVGEVDG